MEEAITRRHSACPPLAEGWQSPTEESQDNADITINYTYDSKDRRISKTVNGTTTKYKYDGWNVLREMNSDETQTLAEYTYDQFNRPVSMRRNNATYYYIYNARGDITAVMDSNGAITNSYTYNPWGKILSISEQVENPFRYASYRYDTETGLYYLQNRYYSPELMRFITRDAIRDEAGVPHTSNYYQYADGNPVNITDPDGLCGVYLVRRYYVTKTYGWFDRASAMFASYLAGALSLRVIGVTGSIFGRAVAKWFNLFPLPEIGSKVELRYSLYSNDHVWIRRQVWNSRGYLIERRYWRYR